MFLKFFKKIFFGLLLTFFLFSCRGEFSKEPPIHLNINMDFQPKKRAQSLSKEIPEGVVAFGSKSDPNHPSRENFIPTDTDYFTGKNNGRYIERIPSEIKIDRKFLERGKKNFNIYCAVCHDRVGTGNGVVVRRGVGIPPPPNLSEERLLQMNDGEIFEVISLGRRNMPGYSTQIEILDRWAVVSYVRVLQAARTASVKDVPSGVKLN